MTQVIRFPNAETTDKYTRSFGWVRIGCPHCGGTVAVAPREDYDIGNRYCGSACQTAAREERESAS